MTSRGGESLARAPGKLVLSGSYSVLYGAPAIVTAVSRTALADPARKATHIADEVAAAVRLGLVPAPCYIDASELRTDDGAGGTRKLGLGSSAAILIATISAFRGAPTSDEARTQMFRDGLKAHREAQGGGSGVDVAASTFGGTLAFLRGKGDEWPTIRAISLPADLVIAVYAAREAALTQRFVASVRAFAERDPGAFAPLMETAQSGAHRATQAEDTLAFTQALAEQRDALETIGARAGVEIVTPDVRTLADAAAREGAFFGPSGAGGGDVAFFAARVAPSASFDERARALRYDRLDLTIGAPGAAAVTA